MCLHLILLKHINLYKSVGKLSTFTNWRRRVHHLAYRWRCSWIMGTWIVGSDGCTSRQCMMLKYRWLPKPSRAVEVEHFKLNKRFWRIIIPDMTFWFCPQIVWQHGWKNTFSYIGGWRHRNWWKWWSGINYGTTMFLEPAKQSDAGMGNAHHSEHFDNNIFGPLPFIFRLQTSTTMDHSVHLWYSFSYGHCYAFLSRIHERWHSNNG